MSTRKAKSPLNKSATPSPAPVKAASVTPLATKSSLPAAPLAAKPAPVAAPTKPAPAPTPMAVKPAPAPAPAPVKPQTAPAPATVAQAPVAAAPAPTPVAVKPAPTRPVPSPKTGRVCLELVKPGAKQVCVAGSFNQWKPEQAPLVQMGNGRWVGDLSVSPGRYEYLFVVDGQWLPDPNAKETVQNPFGGVNSVLTVSN